MSGPASTEITLCAALPLPAADAGGAIQAPKFIHLVPAGEIRTADGRGPYRMTDAAKVAASFVPGDRLPIDENHATDYAAPKGGPSPARGWIVGLQARQDGLWGEVEWTSDGRKLVEDRAYRQISPAIVHLKSGDVVGIARASLVNAANFLGLTTLHSQQGQSMDLTKELRKALGLPENAGDDAILAAVNGQAARLSTHAAMAKALGVAETADTAIALQGVQAATTKAFKAALAPINKALGLAEDAEAAVALQTVQALKDPAHNVPAAQVVALQSQLTALTQSVAKERAEAFVDAAIAAGKVGIKPLRDHYVARHMADPAGVEKEIGAMVSLQGARQTPQLKEGGTVLEEADLRIIAMMGIDPKAYAAARAAEEKRV
jgi:phage I-like protein